MNSDESPSLWGDGSVRAFVCHNINQRDLVFDLQSQLRRFGIAVFVPDEHMERIIQFEVSEIVQALFSMDVLIAVLSSDFRESEWTDLEAGIAIGRNVPVIPVEMATPPIETVRHSLLREYTPVGHRGDETGTALGIFERILRINDLRDRLVHGYVQSINNDV